MIKLSKRERDTLREINNWRIFYANWKPKTRARLEQMSLVANISPPGKKANYQLTDKGKLLLRDMMAAGVYS